MGRKPRGLSNTANQPDLTGGGILIKFSESDFIVHYQDSFGKCLQMRRLVYDSIQSGQDSKFQHVDQFVKHVEESAMVEVLALALNITAKDVAERFKGLSYFTEAYAAIWKQNFTVDDDAKKNSREVMEDIGIVASRTEELLLNIYQVVTDKEYIEKLGAEKVLKVIGNMISPSQPETSTESSEESLESNQTNSMNSTPGPKQSSSLSEDTIPNEEDIQTGECLDNFPYDIPFIDDTEVESLAKWSKGLELKGTPADEHVWDEARASAALGDEIIPKRAAQQGWLWIWYKQMTMAGVVPDMTMLEVRVRLQNEVNKVYENTDIKVSVEKLKAAGKWESVRDAILHYRSELERLIQIQNPTETVDIDLPE